MRESGLRRWCWDSRHRLAIGRRDLALLKDGRSRSGVGSASAGSRAAADAMGEELRRHGGTPRNLTKNLPFVSATHPSPRERLDESDRFGGGSHVRSFHVRCGWRGHVATEWWRTRPTARWWRRADAYAPESWSGKRPRTLGDSMLCRARPRRVQWRVGTPCVQRRRATLRHLAYCLRQRIIFDV